MKTTLQFFAAFWYLGVISFLLSTIVVLIEKGFNLGQGAVSALCGGGTGDQKKNRSLLVVWWGSMIFVIISLLSAIILSCAEHL